MPRALLLLTSLFLFAQSLHAGAVPPELEKALAAFHAEGTKGWAFTQTTSSSTKSLVERYDPSKPEFNRWTLLKKDGHDPAPDDIKQYKDVLSRRTRGEVAPNVKDQIRRDTCEPLGVENGRALYRFQLKSGGEDDRSAEHMNVTFSLHQESGTIERVELASIRPFSPMFAVKIDEARTVITYSLPEPGRPTLLREITVRVRGRAMLLKSLDQDMTVAYSDYASAGKKD